MKIQVMSDLHLEMHADGGAEFIRELDPTGVDVLVLAGGTSRWPRYYESLANVFEPLAIISTNPLRPGEPRVRYKS